MPLNGGPTCQTPMYLFPFLSLLPPCGAPKRPRLRDTRGRSHRASEDEEGRHDVSVAGSTTPGPPTSRALISCDSDALCIHGTLTEGFNLLDPIATIVLWATFAFDVSCAYLRG
jgi:hypothetical protein